MCRVNYCKKPVKYGYTEKESALLALPLSDVFYVLIGDCDEGTKRVSIDYELVSNFCLVPHKDLEEPIIISCKVGIYN